MQERIVRRTKTEKLISRGEKREKELNERRKNVLEERKQKVRTVQARTGIIGNSALSITGRRKNEKTYDVNRATERRGRETKANRGRNEKNSISAKATVIRSTPRKAKKSYISPRQNYIASYISRVF